MKLFEILERAEKAKKELRTETKIRLIGKGGERVLQIRIDDDPIIIFEKLETDDYENIIFSIDVRDWENVKDAVDKLLNKEYVG